LFGHPGETVDSKPRSLIRVEDLRRSVAAQGFLEGLVAKVLIQGIGKTSGQDFAAVPVYDRHQVHKPTGHGNVDDIGCPNLIGMIDGQVSEQKGALIFLITR
jgi:hypothetical protein